MNEKELSICLREMARTQKTPLCDEWYDAWKDDSNIDVLLEKYIRGFDFVAKNDYPSLEFSRKVFSKEDLHRHNIYLDDNIQIDEGMNGYYVFLGDSVGRICIDGFKAVTIYIRHNSNIEIKATNGARVFVFLYDESIASFESDEYSVIKTFDKKERK